MNEGLYHPEHVATALARIAELSRNELKAAIQASGSGSAPRLPDEVLVRLIRRSQVSGDAAMHTLVYRALIDRLTRWAWRTYSTLSQEDREDLVGGVVERIFRAVTQTNGIDYWEITFAKNRERAAADVYQAYLENRYRNQHVEYEIDCHEQDDEGAHGAEMVETALIGAWAKRVLSLDETRYFHLLFLSEIPLRSPRASADLVRMLGKPEGTLREIKTAIKNKLKEAWEAQK